MYDGQIFASIIKDALIKLRILGKHNFRAFHNVLIRSYLKGTSIISYITDECSSQLQIISMHADFNAPGRIQFGWFDSLPPDIEPNNLDSTENKIDKLLRDRLTLNDYCVNITF